MQPSQDQIEDGAPSEVNLQDTPPDKVLIQSASSPPPRPKRRRRSRIKASPAVTSGLVVERTTPAPALGTATDPFIEQAQLRVQQLLANASTTSLSSTRSMRRAPTPKKEQEQDSESLFYNTKPWQSPGLAPTVTEHMQVEVPLPPLRSSPSKSKLKNIDAGTSSHSAPLVYPYPQPGSAPSSKLAAAGSAPSRYESLRQNSNIWRNGASSSSRSPALADLHSNPASVEQLVAQVPLTTSTSSAALAAASQRSLPRTKPSSLSLRYEGGASAGFTPEQVPLPASTSNIGPTGTSQSPLPRVDTNPKSGSKASVANNAAFAAGINPSLSSSTDSTPKHDAGATQSVPYADPYPSQMHDHDPSTSTSTLASVRSNDSNKLRKKNSAVLSELNDERKRQREQNRDYFRTRVWDPALQQDYDGAVRLARDEEEREMQQRQAQAPKPAQVPMAQHPPPPPPPEQAPVPPPRPPTPPAQSHLVQRRSNERINRQKSSEKVQQKDKRGSNRISRTDVILQRAKARLLHLDPPPPTPPPIPITKRFIARPVTWVDAGPAAEDWARAVQIALSNLEQRIAREDPLSFLRFLPGKRESMELRTWRAEVRRTPEARLSALALGQAVPSSPFEEAFVAELLRENEEVMLRHGGTAAPSKFWGGEPLARVEETEGEGDRRYNTGRALPPIPVADDRPESARVQKEAVNTMHNIYEQKRMSKMGGQQYKSFSAYNYLDESEQHGCGNCFGIFSMPRKKR